MNRRAILFAALLVPVLSGCATGVGEPAVPSTIAAPIDQWSATEGVRTGNVKMDWWRVLGDPALDRLVEQALAGNADVRVASARLAAADALLRDARAARLPGGGVAAGIERNRTPAAALQLDTVGGPAVLPSQTLADVGASLSWELDLAGRLAATRDAAGADRAKAEWAVRGAQAAVAAGVVRAWLDLAAAREQIALTEQRVTDQESAADVLGQAVALGGVRADQQDDLLIAVRALEAELAGLHAQERNAARRIATLTGTPAPVGVQQLPALQPAQFPVPEFVSAPEPAELLRLRPDVAAAEEEMLKASAGIRIAKADLYPRINFGGDLGLTATPADLGNTGALRFGIGPSLSWGIFDMGRIRARIRAAGAEADAAAASWESAFLKAIEETDTALDQLATARRAWQLARDARLASDQQLSRASIRFDLGQESRVMQLTTSDRARAAQLRESEARSAALLAWVNVQIAFGAGWTDCAENCAPES